MADYEAPAIEVRTPLETPLIGVGSGNVDSSAIFR